MRLQITNNSKTVNQDISELEYNDRDSENNVIDNLKLHTTNVLSKMLIFYSYCLY